MFNNNESSLIDIIDERVSLPFNGFSTRNLNSNTNSIPQSTNQSLYNYNYNNNNNHNYGNYNENGIQLAPESRSATPVNASVLRCTPNPNTNNNRVSNHIGISISNPAVT